MCAPPRAPGAVQGDLVLHCGESTEGFHLSNLVVVDVASGWIELEPIWGVGAVRVGGRRRTYPPPAARPALRDCRGCTRDRQGPSCCPSAARRAERDSQSCCGKRGGVVWRRLSDERVAGGGVEDQLHGHIGRRRSCRKIFPHTTARNASHRTSLLNKKRAGTDNLYKKHKTYFYS